MMDSTEEHSHAQPDTAPWPVPEGSLMPESLASNLESLTYLAGLLEPDALDLIDARPNEFGPTDVWFHDLAVAIDRLETVKDKVVEVQRALGMEFARRMPFPAPSNVAYADCRPLVPRYPANRTGWVNDRLARDVKQRIREAMEKEFSPARDDVPEDLVAGTIEKVERVFSFLGSNAKTTGLKALGLDPDDYCTSEKQDPMVQVIK